MALVLYLFSLLFGNPAVDRGPVTTHNVQTTAGPIVETGTGV